MCNMSIANYSLYLYIYLFVSSLSCIYISIISSSVYIYRAETILKTKYYYIMAFNWYSNIPFKYKLLSKILYQRSKRILFDFNLERRDSRGKPGQLPDKFSLP